MTTSTDRSHPPLPATDHGGARFAMGIHRRDLVKAIAGFSLAGASATLLAACASEMAGLQPAARPVAATTIGAGAVKVALILPLSAAGQAGVAANSMRNAAELALSEFKNANIQILVKDDGGTPESARLATQLALSEGAEIILGPLTAASVTAAGQVAKSAGKPVIAFSTDASVASRGIYLMSFLPESDVERIIGFAASKGKGAFAALLPQSSYGSVTEAAFQQAVAQQGARAVAIERFSAASGLPAAAQRLAPAIAGGAPQADALFLPDGSSLPAAAQALQAMSFNPAKVKLLGTSQWSDGQALGLPALQGGWFAGPPDAGFIAFAARYKARFGSDPVRIASLSYDAVSLVAALERTQGTKRFSEAVLTSPAGFNGADGVFRFREDGLNERALAVYEVKDGKAIVISPAPRTLSR